MKRLLALLLFALPIAAQTVNQGASVTQGTPVNVIWTNPQIQGDTIIVGVVPPGGTLTDKANDSFVQLCSVGNQAIWVASPVSVFTGNVLTYTPPSGTTNSVISAVEYTGQWSIPDGCTTGSGVNSVALIPTAPLASGDLVYAFLSLSTASSGTTVSSGMTFTNYGQADTWWGPGIYSGWNLDAIGTPSSQGVTFTMPAGLGGATGTALMLALKNVAAPQPVLLNITGTIAYDDGSSPFGQSGATFSVLQQEGSSWVSIGQPTIAPNGAVSGTVTVNPNFATNGAVFFEVAISGFPVFYSAGLNPATFEQGSTGLAINAVIFKAILAPKLLSIGLTP